MSISPEERAIVGDTVLSITNPNADSDALHFGLRNNVESSICAIHASLGWTELFHVVDEFEAAAVVKARANGLFDVAPVIEGVSAEATVIDVTPVEVAPTEEAPPTEETQPAPAAVEEAPAAAPTEETQPAAAADEPVDLATFTQEQFAQNNPPADGGAQ